MSWLSNPGSPDFKRQAEGGVDIVVEPSTKDLGGLRVRRALPAAQRRMVGPFVFLDHMGPHSFAAHEGLDVLPHPHIGLATITYLISGSVFHRDTLGSAQDIVPGDVNWMTAGRGIAHSERSSPESRAQARELTGLQSWIALPKAFEEVPPAFFHHAGDSLRSLTDRGVQVRVVAGSAYGETSPVQVFSQTLYADVALAAGASLPLPQEHIERAIYVLSGTVEIAGEVFDATKLLVFRPADRITIRAVTGTRFMMLGGEPCDGPRHIWWNFVSSSKARIAQAKEDWAAGRFGLVQGDEREFIPLPG